MQGDLADYHNGLELSRSYFIKARDFTNAGIASIQIKGFLKELGYGSHLVRKVSICAYEGEMNVVMYGSDGQVKMDLYPHLLCLRVEDHGPGIEDIELAMQEGYSTAPPEYREMGFGAGMGLPNMKKNSDFMEIISSPGKGTLVHMDFFYRHKMKLGSHSQHFVEIDHVKCNGCVLCLKTCPMKAIRVLKDGKAHILGTCIDCGSCISVCPRGAISPKTSASLDEIQREYTIVTVSPVLYTQFGEETMPNEVLIALKTIFDQVYDQAYIQELFSLATEFYLQDKRNDPSQRWPIISPICPVVNRLIYYRFPALLPQLLPFLAPREISARELRKKLLERSSLRPEEIGVYHITPCSAKMLSTKSPLFLNKSHLDGVIGINEIFTKTRSSLGHISDEVIYHYSSGVGIGWAKSGGEISAIDGARTLAVSGIKETITYLEKIELGLLNGIEYVEFRACHEGCIGGKLTAVDKYEAKRRTDRLVRMFGIEKRVRPQYVRKLYESGFFTAERELATLVNPVDVDIRRAINRAKEVQSLWELLPQKECGACGSPDCMTFAEDVIDGLQTPDRCFFLREMRSWN